MRLDRLFYYGKHKTIYSNFLEKGQEILILPNKYQKIIDVMRENDRIYVFFRHSLSQVLITNEIVVIK